MFEKWWIKVASMPAILQRISSIGSKFCQSGSQTTKAALGAAFAFYPSWIFEPSN
jgi:hypothetical protein